MKQISKDALVTVVVCAALVASMVVITGFGPVPPVGTVCAR